MSAIEARLADALAARAELVADDATAAVAAAVDERRGPPVACSEVVDLDEDAQEDPHAEPGGGPASAGRWGLAGGRPGRWAAPGAPLPPAARWRAVVAPVALAAAVAAVVAGTTLGVRALREHARPADPVAVAGRSLAVFREPAVLHDHLPADLLDQPGAHYGASRALGGDDDADYWAALDEDGQVCLVTVTATGGSTTACQPPAAFARHGTGRVVLDLGGSPRRSLTTFLEPDRRAHRSSRDGAHLVARGVYASVSGSEGGS